MPNVPSGTSVLRANACPAAPTIEIVLTAEYVAQNAYASKAAIQTLTAVHLARTVTSTLVYVTSDATPTTTGVLKDKIASMTFAKMYAPTPWTAYPEKLVTTEAALLAVLKTLNVLAALTTAQKMAAPPSVNVWNA